MRSAIYKQLRDFKIGARTSAIMQPLVANLSDRDMRDLAAYYAYLPRERVGQSRRPRGTSRIVADGAPMRNIAPCGACHGDLASKQVHRGWKDSQRFICTRSSRVSPPAPGTTTSTSRCAMSHAE